MSSFNQVVVLGNLTKDPELKYTPQGKAVANFSVATNHRYTKEDGTKVEEVVFLDVAAWNKQAEACAEYLKKGRAVLVTGRLIQDHWEDPQTGKKCSKHRVVAQSVTFVGGGSKDEASSEESLPEETPVPVPTPAPAKAPAKSKR